MACTEALCGLESFNTELLETYQGRVIPEDLVETKWLQLATSISDYDIFVRGITSKAEVRNRLKCLDGIAPLSELPEINAESEPPEKFAHQSMLLLVLKSMFKVPTHTSFCSVIILSDDQMRRLDFSYVLRAVLSYLLHQKVFSVEENGSMWRTFEKCLNTGKLVHKFLVDACADKRIVFGEQVGSAAMQYSRLEILKLDDVKVSLKRRAQQLAHSIYTTLLPLSHWVKDSPTNSKAEHLKLLEKITYQSLCLTTELQSREGTFSFFRPEHGTLFDPDFCIADGSQAEDVKSMAYEVKKKQVIAFVLMPAVLRGLPNEERTLRYAYGVVLLKEPYVDHQHQ